MLGSGASETEVSGLVVAGVVGVREIIRSGAALMGQGANSCYGIAADLELVVGIFREGNLNFGHLAAISAIYGEIATEHMIFCYADHGLLGVCVNSWCARFAQYHCTGSEATLSSV